MSRGQFRFSYFTPDYETTVAFYREAWGSRSSNFGTAIRRIGERCLVPQPG
jgi:hypothetical protein